MASLQQKLLISATSAALFVLISHPSLYKLTNRLLGGRIASATTGCPTMLGLALHTVVFYLVTRWTMRDAYMYDAVKTRRSLIAAVLFAVLNSPMAYQAVRGVLGAGIATASGCPSMSGLVVHAAVYGAILVLLMRR